MNINVIINMKKHSYESPEAEVLEVELEYRLLGYQIESATQVEYDDDL